MAHLKRNKIYRIIVLVIIFLPSFLMGQGLHYKSSNIIDIELEIVINEIVKDENEFLWMASSEGLLFSDGDGFIQVHTIDTLINRNLKSLYYSLGVIYLGWENGTVSIYSTEENKIIKNYSLDISGINSIVTDKEKNIWIGTDEKGVYQINKDKVSIIDINFGLANNVVNDMLYDEKSDIIWVANDRGVSKINNQSKIKITNYSSSDGLTDNLITSIELDSDANLWMGSFSGKLFTLNPEGEIQKIQVGNKYNSDKIVAIKSQENEIWVACEKNGIAVYNNKQCKNVDRNERIKGIKDFLFIQKNQILVLTKKNELLVSDKNMHFYRSLENIDLNNTSVIYNDNNGGIYIANDKFILQKNDKDSIEVIINLIEKKIAYVISVLLDNDGRLWIGTFDQGVYSFKNGILKNYSEKDGLINNNVMAIYEWRNAIWCGTLGGLSKIEITKTETKFSNFSQEQGLEAAYIYQLLDLNNKLYIASDGEGLISFDGKVFSNVVDVGIESVYDITSDSASRLFLSSENGQISVLKDQILQNSYTIKYKDRPVDLTGIILLDKDHLLFAWEQGMGIINTENGFYQFISSSWGLDEFQSDYLNVLSFDNSHEIWIGAQEYLIKLETQYLEFEVKPNSTITSVELFSSTIDTNIHEFSYNENHFSFHLNSAFYPDPKSIIYQYRLLGLDTKWVVTKDKLIVFPKLENGNYRFEFRSGFENQMEGAKIVHYTFSINKAFYFTWWFISLIVFSLGLSIYGVTRYRDKKSILKKKIEYERVLSQFELLKSQINPHFLFNSLNTAYALIANDSEEARSYILSLSKYLRTILTNNQEHVIQLKQELEFAENYSELQKKRFGENLIFDISIEERGIIDTFIPPLTLQILLENAIKHNIISRSNPLTVRVYYKNDYLIIENNLQLKQDNGEGTKIGLSNIKSRYQILFGRDITIVQKKKSFKVKLPIIYTYVKDFID